MRSLSENISWLQKENYKAFYLALLRVAISLWLLKEVFINWSGMDLLYGQTVFIESEKRIINILSCGNPSLFRSHYLFFIIPYIAVILLNLIGIGRHFTAGLLFIMLYVLKNMNTTIQNGGDVLARLIVFYLIVADSYQYFVWLPKKEISQDRQKIRHLLSNLAAFSIMLQLCVSYFGLGLAKSLDPLWIKGEAVYYALINERYMGTPYNEWIVQHAWLVYISNYGTILFELGFPFLIWFKKLRPALLVIGIIFHLSIYIFLMIYGFEIVFMLIYGLFLPNDFLLKYAHKIQNFYGGKPGLITRYIGLADGAKKM